MTSIDQILSDQPGLIPQVIRNLTHARLRADTVFVDHYLYYLCDHLMRGAWAEETLQSKESYKRMAATCGDIVSTNRSDNKRFAYPLFKDAFHNFGQHIIQVH